MVWKAEKGARKVDNLSGIYLSTLCSCLLVPLVTPPLPKAPGFVLLERSWPKEREQLYAADPNPNEVSMSILLGAYGRF